MTISRRAIITGIGAAAIAPALPSIAAPPMLKTPSLGKSTALAFRVLAQHRAEHLIYWHECAEYVIGQRVTYRASDGNDYECVVEAVG